MTALRGQKKCPACSLLVEVDEKNCDCGHEFNSSNSVNPDRFFPRGMVRILTFALTLLLVWLLVVSWLTR